MGRGGDSLQNPCEPCSPEKLEFELARVTSMRTSEEAPFSEKSASGGGARLSGLEGRSGMCSTGGAASGSGSGSGSGFGSGSSTGIEMVMPGGASAETGTGAGRKLPAVCPHGTTHPNGIGTGCQYTGKLYRCKVQDVAAVTTAECVIVKSRSEQRWINRYDSIQKTRSSGPCQ